MASERLFRDDDLEYSVLSPLQLPFAQEFLTDHVTEVHENGRMNASVLPKFDEIFLVGISDDCGIGQTIPQVSLSDCTFGPKITEAMSTLISIDNYFGESEDMILSYTAMSDGSLDYLSDMDQTQQSDESSSNSTCEINNFSDDDRCNDTESRNNHVNLQLNNQILYQHAALGNQQPLACMEDFLKRVKNITKRKTVGAERNKAFLQIVKDFREKMPDRKLRCKICGFISHRADHVKTHLARHANLKLYQCAMCGKVFTRQDEETRHKKKHCSKRQDIAARDYRRRG